MGIIDAISGISRLRSLLCFVAKLHKKLCYFVHNNISGAIYHVAKVVETTLLFIHSHRDYSISIVLTDNLPGSRTTNFSWPRYVFSWYFDRTIRMIVDLISTNFS